MGIHGAERVGPTRESGEAPVASFLSVVSTLLVGLVLVVVPWTSFWESNYLVHPHPMIRAVLLSPFTRGAVTGLGLVNLLLALLEAHHSLSDLRDRP